MKLQRDPEPKDKRFSVAKTGAVDVRKRCSDLVQVRGLMSRVSN